VKDASAGVLPGVAVEAASPVLIEKTRTATTDATGQYRIVDLRPGIYTVTFNLTGFTSVKREGVELTGSFTASINAEFKGQLYLSGVPVGWVGSNYTDALENAGLTTPGALIKQWDFNGGIGGPIRKDKLWFFGTLRDEGQYRTIPGIYPNLNAGDPTKWLYVPDKSREARGAESWTVGTIRVTWQASARNKFNFYWDEQRPCNGAVYSNDVSGCRKQPSSGAVIGPLGLGGLTATTSPEVAGYLSPYGQRAQQATWTSPPAGVAYDLFGTGKTSLKVNVGKYLEPASNGNGNYSMANPTSRIATMTNRAWTDANGNFKPDCDLVNPLRQDNRATGGDFIRDCRTAAAIPCPGYSTSTRFSSDKRTTSSRTPRTTGTPTSDRTASCSTSSRAHATG